MVKTSKFILPVTDTDILKDLVHTGEIKPVLKLIDHYVVQLEQALIAQRYKAGEEQKVLNKKVAADGARDMLNAVKRHLEQIKGSKLVY